MQWYYRNEAMYRDSGSIPLTTTIVPCNFTVTLSFRRVIAANGCGKNRTVAGHRLNILVASPLATGLR